MALNNETEIASIRARLEELDAKREALTARLKRLASQPGPGANSKSDAFVDPSPRTTLMTLAAIQLDAEHLLGVHVDVLTPNSIPQRIRYRVLVEAIPV
jgi:uncharacterized protein